MNSRLILACFIIILVPGFLYSQEAEERPGSRCDIPSKNKRDLEDWLNRSFDEVKKAVKNGRIYDNGNHKLPPCKIQEIENLYKNLIFEYDCNCGECGWGGVSHHLKKGRPYIRICQPIDMYLNREEDLNKPPTTLCGCIQGLIVHELVHATGDPSEEGPVDCSKILYTCANDPYGDETTNHENCECCEKKGE